MAIARLDDFERLRQVRETRNERLIAAILGGVLTAVACAYSYASLAHVARKPVPVELFAILAVLVLSNAAIELYLRRNPPYSPWRKFIFAAIPVIGYSLNGRYEIGLAYNPAESLPNLAPYLIYIGLSGLRYDTRVVYFTGALSLAGAYAAFAPISKGPVLVGLMLGSPIILGGMTVTTAFAVSSLLQLHREAVLRHQLGRFLPTQLVDQVIRNPEILQRETLRREGTVLFADLVGFTALAEHLEPQAVVRLLNRYLEIAAAAVDAHGGMLDKFLGDAVMAVFGVAGDGDDHARRAVCAAVELQERLARLNEDLAKEGLPTLRIGIGVHTGELVVGGIGAVKRLDYTVIGDTVNVASRIERLTREQPASLLVSDATAESVRASRQLREIGTLSVRGRSEPVTVWTLCDPAAPVRDAVPAPHPV